LIFIDDDEVAGEDWLLHYADTLKRKSADVIHGRVIYKLPAEDRWAHLLERNVANDQREDGKVVHSAATNNVMISSRLFSTTHMALEFDTALRFSGGSDTEFFNRARSGGATLIYSAGAVVYEYVPIERCSFTRLLQREARVSAAGAYIDSRHYGKKKAIRKHARRSLQNLAQSIGYFILSGCFLPISRIKSKTNFLKSGLRASRAYGRLLGMSGRLLSPYKTIDRISEAADDSA
jgi:GT2 family glycosyltransferase